MIGRSGSRDTRDTVLGYIRNIASGGGVLIAGGIRFRGCGGGGGSGGES